MNVQVESSKDYTIVSVEGRIDSTNASEFEKPMMGVIERGCTKIILDCSGLNYISSSGLRVFLIVQKKMIAVKGQFSLCNLQPGIKEIFDISGFSSIFSVFPDKKSAMKS
ncbi:MAG: STAS domain-containing protein [Bacteroidales bacterium]|nr:STAS domain-containing protein [Bacteroidales bacterium]